MRLMKEEISYGESILQQQVEVSRRQMGYNFESEREMGVETKTGFKPI